MLSSMLLLSISLFCNFLSVCLTQIHIVYAEQTTSRIENSFFPFYCDVLLCSIDGKVKWCTQIERSSIEAINNNQACHAMNVHNNVE